MKLQDVTEETILTAAELMAARWYAKECGAPERSPATVRWAVKHRGRFVDQACAWLALCIGLEENEKAGSPFPASPDQ